MRDPFGWPRGPFPVRLGAPALDLNFLTGTMPSGLTFTRASTATYIGSDGLLKTAAVDVPRFDYDPVTLACKGLLIEESRTNLLTYSSEFDNAAWTKARSTISANSAMAPDGSTSADKLVEDTTLSSTHLLNRSGISFTLGTMYTLSIYAKAAERTQITLVFGVGAFGSGSGSSTLFNLTTGVTSNLTGAVAAASMQDVGGGWWRCNATLAATATVTDLIQYRLVFGGTETYTGNGTSGIYVWGAGLQAGAFNTSHIPTVASAVTRAADRQTMTGANFSRWFNPVEGTIVAEFSTITNGLSNTGGNAFPFVYDIDSAAAATSGHSLLASAGYGPGVRAQTQVAGVFQAELTSAVTLGTGAIIRHAYTYKANRFAASLNGGAVLTDVLGSLPTPDRLSIGSQDAGGSNTASIHLRRILYYPRGVDDGRVQQLAVAA